MPYAQYPMMNWDQLIEDHAKALEQLPPKADRPPTYAHATQSQSKKRPSSKVKVAEQQVSEKEKQQQQQQQQSKSETPQPSASSQKQPNKFSALKAIFTGTVSKKKSQHMLDGSLNDKPSPSRRSSTSSEECEK